MKKQLTLPLTFIMALGLLLGCQPTPEEKVIIGKNQSAMLSAAVKSSGNSKLSEIVVPERYKFDRKGADGKLEITADASVILPDSKKLPTAKVIPGGFTQEMVSGMLDYLFGDEPYYLTDNSVVMTKEEIQSAIVSMQASIADGTYEDDPEMEVLCEQQINTLKEKYSSAPETKDEPVISDGIMILDPETGASIIDVHSINLDSIGGGAYFYCSSSKDTLINADTSQLSYSNYLSEDNDYIAYTMDKAISVDYDSDISSDLKGKLGVTLAEAKRLAQGLLDAAGVQDMYCGAAYVVDDHGTGNADGYTGPASDYAIKLYYSRSVNGSHALTLGEIGQTTESEYDYCWMYEDMEVLITDGGIIEITWNNPCAVSEIVTEDTNLIGFDQAAEIFEEKIPDFYEAKLDYYSELGCKSINVNIDNIELGLLRIKQQNTEGTKAGLYVPVWAFYGTVANLYSGEGIEHTLFNSGGEFLDGPYIVFAINAIDGSIIDIERGY